MSANTDDTFVFKIDSDLVNLLEKLNFEAAPAVQTDTPNKSKPSDKATEIDLFSKDIKGQLNNPSNDDIDSTTYEKSIEIKSNKINETDPWDKSKLSDLKPKFDGICNDIKELLNIPLDNVSESAKLVKCTEFKSNKTNEEDFHDETKVESHTLSTNKEEAENDLFCKSLKSSTPLSHESSDGKTTDYIKSQSSEELSDTGDESVLLRERYPTRHIRHENLQPFQVYYIPQRHLRTDRPLPSYVNNCKPSLDACSSTWMRNESNVNSTHEFPNLCITNTISFNNDFPISSSSETFYSPSTSTIFEKVLDATVPNLNVESLQNSLSGFSNISNSSSTLSEVVQEDSFSQIKLLTTEEFEDVLKDLPESSPSNCSTSFNKELYELIDIPQLPGEEVKRVLSTLSNSSHDLNITGNSQNHQTNIYCTKGFENAPVSMYDRQDTPIIINPDEENATLDDLNNLYIADEIITSFSSVDAPTDTSSSSSSFEEDALSSLSKSTEYDNISLEIDYKIQQYLDNEFEKDNILVQIPESPESSCDLTGVQLNHDSLPSASVYRELSQVNGSISLHPNQVDQPVIQKSEFCKITCIFGTAAKTLLVCSSSFSNEKRLFETRQILLQIQNKEYGTEQKKVIHYLKVDRNNKYKRTNLHDAVITGNIERAFCIVEIHKRWHSTRLEINLWDGNKKTALDLAKKSGMDLLVDYLRENLGKEACSLNSPSHIYSTGA